MFVYLGGKLIFKQFGKCPLCVKEFRSKLGMAGEKRTLATAKTTYPGNGVVVSSVGNACEVDHLKKSATVRQNA